VKRVALDDVGVQGPFGKFTGVDHGGERARHALDFVASSVERDNRRATARRLEGVSTKATAQIEDLVAGL
jgi:hypothetical protein